ncbi:MAG TPA: hypothetical protein VE596_18245 [Gaiellaceae bacterium]|jgi:hypothetical protein|nr:hypothetical protein [Gaiellaceae bacterium]
MKDLVQRLIKGLEVKSRTSGNLHNVKAGAATVAEVVVGSKTVRVNFKSKPTIKTGVKLAGESSKWAGGGVVVTEENVADVRRLIESAVAGAGQGSQDQPEPPKPSRLRPAKDKTQQQQPAPKPASQKRTGVQPFATAAAA